MIAALLWKEYREHRVVWAAIAFVGAASILGLPLVMASGGLEERTDAPKSLVGVAIALVWLYGMVCGAMLLALEREMGTLPFLDGLPGYRRQVWLGKFLAGVLLVSAQIAFLMAIAAAGRLFRNGEEAAFTLGLMACLGASGFAWGMLCSAYGRSVMMMILFAFAGQMAASVCIGCLAGLAAALVAAVRGPGFPEEFPFFLAILPLLTVPIALIGSHLRFTRLDRSRWRPAPSSVRPDKPRLSWSVLFWLTWRQARGFAVGLPAFALLLGCFVPADGVTLWPITTLVVGMLCGVTAFADEQQGPFHFLGDQRLPLTRLWLVKVGVRFLIAVAAALIVLAPSFFIGLGKALELTQSRGGDSFFPSALVFYTFHSNLVGLPCPMGLFLTVWLIYGFAAGCLCGLLFRNGLAAGVFALFTSVLLTGLWAPSMLGGGLHAWQVFGTPVLLLLSTRWLLRPWAAGRIASWTTAARLTPFIILALLWTAGGLWYRVLEIPNIPEKADLDAFRASLPRQEENEGGELARHACLRFAELSRTLSSDQPSGAGRPGDAPPPRPLMTPPLTRTVAVLDRGWNADDAELAAWLDKLFAGDWVEMLKKASDLPPGMFDDFRNMTLGSPLPATQAARELAAVLAARGLQQQAAGDDEAYVENLRIGLSLSGTMRQQALPIDVAVGRAVEVILRKGLDRWLEKLNGRPDLLQKVLVVLSRYRDTTVENGEDQELAQDLLIKNTLDDPLAVLELNRGNQPYWPGRNDPSVRMEAEWVGMAWLVPWERERQARLLRVAFWGDKDARRQVLPFMGRIGPLPEPGSERVLGSRSPLQQCVERAMLLKLALRWYQADNDGKPAARLEDLTPKYLSSLPLDPYANNEPFHYRLSRGEEIAWPPDVEDAAGVGAQQALPTRKVAAGQGVLWSVGTDGQDDGGVRQSSAADGVTRPGEDLIFLVPPPNGR